MKYRKFLLFTLFALCTAIAMGQAKKPTLMVVPSDAWCKEHRYEQAFDNQGTQEMLPDYSIIAF